MAKPIESKTTPESRTTILFMDDDWMRLEYHVSRLERFAKVFKAQNPDEAYELFQRHHQDIKIVVLDIQMPIGDEMSSAETKHGTRTGIALWRKMKALDPNFKTIVYTVVGRDEIDDEVFLKEIELYLRKPMLPSKLAEQVSLFIRTRL